MNIANMRRLALMDRYLADKILTGVKAAGSYDPKEVLHHVEESLTGAEYDEAEAFLGWVDMDEPARHFGHGNLYQVYEQFKQETERKTRRKK